MKTRITRKDNNRTPRIIYTPGEPELKSNIEFSENLFVGRQFDYTWSKKYKGYTKKMITPTCSNNVTGQTRRYFYIMWFLRDRDIGYKYYENSERSWQDVVKDKLGNCCDLSVLVNVLAAQSGMATNCGTPITTRRYVKDKIYQNGETYYHIYNEFTINKKKLYLDATNYVATGNQLPLGKSYGPTTDKGIYINKYKITGDKKNPVSYISSADLPCTLAVG